VFPLEFPHDVFGDERKVVHAAAERRNQERYDIQTVEEVFPEFSAVGEIFQVLVGGGDQPEVALDDAVAPEAFELLVFEDAEQLRLHLHRQIADLVQEDGPAVGQFEFSRLHLVGRARERPRLVPEKLRLQKILGNGGAVQTYEGVEAAFAGVVDGVGE